ncbi:uncharacterized protein V6R79_003281 [Siganus canaliculatus]
MQNFFLDHSQDAFGSMSQLLADSFTTKAARKKHENNAVNIQKVKNFTDLLGFKRCQRTYSSATLDRYCALMSDVVHGIPPELLGALLYEELTQQRENLLFPEATTGGALAFVPGSQSGQRGCLLYPGNPGLSCLNFHTVELQHDREGCSRVDVSSSNPFKFQLKSPVRQISTSSLFNESCVAVRADHLCGVWRFREESKPHLLQVVNTKEVATCISSSPHVLGEVLVASESGAANLWTVGKAMQKVREEDDNLYFNAKSSWRWCEFSAHPRVMLYADRTGVELTDIRANPALTHTLFRISNTSGCRRGERLILSQYLGDAHCFHHLITTQYSAYIMDERFPCMPMIKWDHMMQSPPMFCHVVPGSASFSSGLSGDRTTKVLLGSHSSQEVTLLQYSGGGVEACSSCGPPQSLHRPQDCLKHLPVQIPHRLDTATDRLSSPVAGLTCIQQKGGRDTGGKERLCVFQLTEAGDIFYQMLEPDSPDSFGAVTAEDQPLPRRAEPLPPDSKHLVSDTSSDESIVEPTQYPNAKTFVTETPEREQQEQSVLSDSSSLDSESVRRKRSARRMLLQVVVNDPELDEVTQQDAGEEDGDVAESIGDNSGERESGQEKTSSSSHMTPVKLSNSTLVTWKRWLQKVMKKRCETKPHQHSLQHRTVPTEGLLQPSDTEEDAAQEARAQSVRRDLRACMFKRSLLVNREVSASDEPVVPLPNTVNTDAWTDPLSCRLTLSWQGEGEWRRWWEDQLGLNNDKKVEALKRRRRREKEARRRAGLGRLDLSGSFTSSVSYQSELDDFSDSTGWSSAASQGLGSQSEDFSDHPSTPATPVWTDTPQTTPATTPNRVQDEQVEQQIPELDTTLNSTPRRVKEREAEQQTPSTSQNIWTLDSTPSSQRRNKRPAKDFWGALCAPQDQMDSYFLEDESTASPPPAPEASRLRSSQSTFQRTCLVDLSQDASIMSGFHQSRSQSQSSHGQLSQSSQPRKKSRMGF